MPLSPEWAKLPKRHCDDCGKLYKPVKPSRPGERWFCSANCRKSYHKHGGAYRKLKVEITKEITKQVKDLEKRFREAIRIGEVREIVREEIAASAERMREIAREEIEDRELPPDMTHAFRREHPNEAPRGRSIPVNQKPAAGR